MKCFLKKWLLNIHNLYLSKKQAIRTWLRRKKMVVTEYVWCTCTYHSNLFPFILDLNKTAFALYFYLDSDDWKLLLCVKAEGKTPVVSIWTLEGWYVLLSRSIFKCMTLHRCLDSKSLAKSVISLQLVTTSANNLRGEWSSRMAENCKCLTMVNDNFFP